ncbi:GNAT family N-acetyltransferase [Paenibacillus terrigena]|uniref:GNAT family N-acetyltransferase n=1 Tax=Paenibacillus terrigena TaxID=369333 RepID=UPI0028D78A0F|nr:GNAT family N-acetyltransferase [Paenibacillus terrigena]
MNRKLSQAELEALLEKIEREQHFLYYSYLTNRRHNTIHYGQFTDEGELLGVMAFLTGLSFNAFSVYPVQESFRLQPLLSFMQQELHLPNDAIGSFIVTEEEMALLAPQLEFIKPPKELLLMKHIDEEAVPPGDHRVVRLGPSDYERIESMMVELNTMAFSREELQHPFFGVMDQQDLIAVGGYHVYSADYVELGNIGTDLSKRRQGLGRHICAELTRQGRLMTPHVYLNVLKENTAAVQLYCSLGYEVICKQYIAEFAI